MTIKDAVKATLARLAGNVWHDVNKIDPPTFIDQSGNLVVVEPSQFRRALRDLPYVQRNNRGQFRLRGRAPEIGNRHQ